MRVYLDDTEIQIEHETLASAISAGTAASEAKGRIIVEVWADGAPAPDEDLATPPDASPYAEEIKLISAEPKALVRTVLLDVSDALTGTRDTQREAADHLQTGETGPALHRLGEALQTWETVRRAVDEGCALLDLPTTGDGAAGLDGALVNDLADKLTALRDALGREDWSVLSDLLAYDLDEHVDRWQAELQRLAAHIAHDPTEATS